MKTWISERQGWLTTAIATLALVIAIAALTVGIANGDNDSGRPEFGNGMAPPQGAIAPGTMVPPDVQGSGTPADPYSYGGPGSNNGGSGSGQ